MMDLPDAMWAADPTGVFTHRWWDGSSWTDRVAIDGVEGLSPIGADAASAAWVAQQLRPSVVPPPPVLAAPPVWAPGPGLPPGQPYLPAQPFAQSYAPSYGQGAAYGGVGIDPVTGLVLAPVGMRIGAYLLEVLLILVTLVIGWFIWAVITASEGQTPAKRLLGIQVVDATTGRPLTWGTYVFLRGLIGWGVQAILEAFLIGYILRFMPLWDRRDQHLPAKISNSIDVMASSVAQRR